jgi:Protein of unknown function (DUF1592)/Protein of unknown function (DUF1588)/Protein of unknown function (DUF1595)/Protein of unknown function (DUF1587)
MRNILLMRTSVMAAFVFGASACTGAVGSGGETTGPVGGGSPGVVAPPPSSAGPCNQAASLGPARVWRLTDQQYVKAVSQVFGVLVPPEVTAPDTQPADFTNLSEVVSVDSRAAAAYSTTARTAALAAVTANLATFLPCGGSDACVESFIHNRVARAFRRPVTDTEVASLMSLYHMGATDDVATGLGLVIQATLQSPSFLYRTEIGAPIAGGPKARVPLTAFELATAISFALLDSVPDDTLWKKAQDQSLLSSSVLAAEIDRLMALPEVQENLSQNAGFWLGVERLHQTEKETSAGYFPEFTAALKQELYDSSRLFVRDVVTKGKVTDLLTSSRMYVNDDLARIYGLPGGMGSELVAMDVSLPERGAGILSQPAILAAFSRPDRGDPIHRGLFIYNSIICGTTLPEPPANALAIAATFPTNASERDLAGLRAANPNGCGTCHGMFDPLGLATERYDPIGRYHATDKNGAPIDASAVLTHLGADVDGPITGLPDLVDKLKTGRRVSDCAATNIAEFVLGRSVVTDNSCALQDSRNQLAASGSFKDYFRALLTSPGFLTRDAEN